MPKVNLHCDPCSVVTIRRSTVFVHCVTHHLTQCDVFWQEALDPGEGTTKDAQSSHGRAERSLEESRKLILQWADELRDVDRVSIYRC